MQYVWLAEELAQVLFTVQTRNINSGCKAHKIDHFTIWIEFPSFSLPSVNIPNEGAQNIVCPMISKKCNKGWLFDLQFNIFRFGIRNDAHEIRQKDIANEQQRNHYLLLLSMDDGVWVCVCVFVLLLFESELELRFWSEINCITEWEWCSIINDDCNWLSFEWASINRIFFVLCLSIRTRSLNINSVQYSVFTYNVHR